MRVAFLDEINERTAYLATAMNEIKNKLENEIELLKNRVQSLEATSEVQSTFPVTDETTLTDDDAQTEIAIAVDKISPKVGTRNILHSHQDQP